MFVDLMTIPWFRTVLVAGIFCIPTSWHVLIMTFMNAKVQLVITPGGQLVSSIVLHVGSRYVLVLYSRWRAGQF
jgi:hypothetical protein